MGNSCLNCDSSIPAKTKAGKPRKFCDKSCARKYTCRTKPEVVEEANKKGFQTLLRENPEVVSSRGRMTEKKRVALKKLEEQGHFKSMHLKSTYACDHEKRKQTMIEKGHFLDPEVFDHKEFKRYQQAAHRMTRKLYGSAGKGYHWDHVVPVMVGFQKEIPLSVLSSKENIKRIKASENLSKGSTLTSEAIELLEKWA